jgi:hypothetical protein
MTLSDGDFILAAVGEDNNRKVLQGSCEKPLLWDEKDITLGYPDYSASVSLGEVNSYTAEQDGWFAVIGDPGASKKWEVMINGSLVAANGGENHNTNSLFIPVKKGDTISINFVASTAGMSMYFYPNR